MSEQAVIHKVVFDLSLVSTFRELGEVADVQTFEMPIEAALVAIDWDTRNQHGIALWYRRLVGSVDAATTWRVMVRGTGHEFPAAAGHLGTVVRDGFAWHVLDFKGNVRW